MSLRGVPIHVVCALALFAGCSGTQPPAVERHRAGRPVPAQGAPPRVSEAVTPSAPAAPVAGTAPDQVPEVVPEYACDPGVKSPVAASAVRVEKTPTSPCKRLPVQGALRDLPDYLREYECRGPSRIILGIASEDERAPEVVVLEIRGSYTADDKQVTFTTIGAWRIDSGVICRSVERDARKDGPVDAVAAKLAAEVLGGGCDCPAP